MKKEKEGSNTRGGARGRGRTKCSKHEPTSKFLGRNHPTILINSTEPARTSSTTKRLMAINGSSKRSSSSMDRPTKRVSNSYDGQQKEEYTKMYEIINNSAAEYERFMSKVMQEQAQLREDQAQQRELLQGMNNRQDAFYKSQSEYRMFREARHRDKVEYDMRTQARLNYVCGTLPVLNPQIQTFGEVYKVLEEQEISRVKFNEQSKKAMEQELEQEGLRTHQAGQGGRGLAHC
ncbi:hypothetical protein Ahy_A01g001962 isoform A [Arachis hypogaea]|uniref:Uncharacterized protein n=1 Tax=Arachis hypogaea TaxID=3818 RepID=A0A445EPS3_ARAHY|nr:hypothetical protein Ahy_A01g001962 isoform A [Arachis hypogaea]